ncbi:MAG: methyltransferase domain-containing protein [Chloroflexi bacterium]|nr:methyltransferase domain-containing protein [Chloroflexota bacterium]
MEETQGTIRAEEVMRAYDAKFGAEGFRNNETFYRWALDFVAPQPGELLLDVACGLGDLLRFAAARGVQAYGVDLSSVAARATANKVPAAHVAVANGERLPFADETFDHVTILGSLEHFLDPGQGLLEIRRVLKWGGHALVLVPNSYYLPDILWRVVRTGRGPDHKQIVERFAACQDWRAFIEAGGLRVLRVRRFNFQWPRSRDDWAWYRANPRRLLGLLAAPFIPFNLSHSFLYLCQKDPASRDKTYHPPRWPAPPRLADLP